MHETSAIGAHCTVAGTADEVRGSFVFKLSDVRNYTSYKALYDDYRIVWVKVIFSPLVTSIEAVATPNAVVRAQPFYTVIDYNDNTSSETVAELSAYGNCKIHPMFGRPFYVFLRPKVLEMLYLGPASTAYQAKPGGWISTDNDGVPHYGVKYASNGCNFGAAGSDIILFSVSIQYGLEFRCQK